MRSTGWVRGWVKSGVQVRMVMGLKGPDNEFCILGALEVSRTSVWSISSEQRDGTV